MKQRLAYSAGAAAVLMGLFLLALVAGCNDRDDDLALLDDDDDMGLLAMDDQGQTPRLVSLAPALTQMVVDLGKGEWIVGVSEHDAAAPPGARVVGNAFNPNVETVLALEPTHVLVMADKIPDGVVNLSAAGRFEIVRFPYPESVQDVSDIIFHVSELTRFVQGLAPEDIDDDAPISLATFLGIGTELALKAKLKMDRRLEDLRRLTSGQTKPLVLLLTGTRTLGASGPQTVLDSLLWYVGAFNVLGEGYATHVQLDREKLLSLKPAVIVLLMPGAPRLRSIDTDSRLSELRGLDIPAVQNNRVVLVSDPHVHLPSSTLPRVAAAMAKAIHPELADQIDQLMATDGEIATDSDHDASQQATDQPGAPIAADAGRHAPATSSPTQPANAPTGRPAGD